MEYDFKINNKKIQKKVGYMDKINIQLFFSMLKNNGAKCYKNYDIGDKDIYWFNCVNKVVFYVLPEHIN